MRSTLALAGLAAAAATFVAPVAPASAYCGPTIIVLNDGGGCSNPCYTTGYAYETARTATSAGSKLLPSYWDIFACLA
jgi:hypothetical protein